MNYRNKNYILCDRNSAIFQKPQRTFHMRVLALRKSNVMYCILFPYYLYISYVSIYAIIVILKDIHFNKIRRHSSKVRKFAKYM